MLTDYISAANEILETKEQLQVRRQPTAQELAAAILDHALARRNQARKRLLLHKKRKH